VAFRPCDPHSSKLGSHGRCRTGRTLPRSPRAFLVGCCSACGAQSCTATPASNHDRSTAVCHHIRPRAACTECSCHQSMIVVAQNFFRWVLGGSVQPYPGPREPKEQQTYPDIDTGFQGHACMHARTCMHWAKLRGAYRCCSECIGKHFLFLFYTISFFFCKFTMQSQLIDYLRCMNRFYRTTKT
jgi:hypothetical protein